MKIKKLLASVVALGLITTSVQAAEDSERVAPEDVQAWEFPSVVYGSYLQNDEANRGLTDELLGTQPDDIKGYVTGADTARFIDLQGVADDVLISSVRIQRTEPGTGIQLTINEEVGSITMVDEHTYANALLTSGMYDAEVVITSFADVTGESALAGIFKAQELQGEYVDEERARLAQEELDALTEINEALKDQAGYSQEQLNKAITEMKTEVAESEGDLSEQALRDIVDEALENNGIASYVNEEYRNKIVIMLINAIELNIFEGVNADRLIESGRNLLGEIVNTPEFKDAREEASKLGNNIVDAVASEEMQESAKGWFDAIIEFFKNLLDTILGWFGGGEATTEE